MLGIVTFRYFASTRAIELVDIAQIRPKRSADDVAHVARQDHRGGARVGARGRGPGGSMRSPLPVAIQTRPLPSVARPRVTSSVVPSGRQFWPSKRARPSEVATQIAPSLPRAIACTSSLASPSFSLQVRSCPSCQRLTPASDE